MLNYVEPKFEEESFNCPHCQELTNQRWKQIYSQQDPSTYYAFCQNCYKCSIWENEKLIYPDIGMIPVSSKDMPENVKEEYEEARLIVNKSPKGACALLRLAVEKLINYLGMEGNSLDEKIDNLVKEGLPIEVQKALESIKIIGENAVHPGELDLEDDATTASAIFALLNFIVEDRITRPNDIKDIYNSLPENKNK